MGINVYVKSLFYIDVDLNPHVIPKFLNSQFLYQSVYPFDNSPEN